MEITMTWYETLAVSALGGFVSLSLKWLFDYFFHKVKIRGQKDVFIHQTQFEKEFGAYVDIWVNIPDLTACMLSYDDFSTARLIEKREKELPGLFDKTMELIAKNEPFLHPSVFESCMEYCKQVGKFQNLNRKMGRLEQKVKENAVNNNGNVTESDDKKWHDLYEQWDKSLTEIFQSQAKIKDCIRKRIWNT